MQMESYQASQHFLLMGKINVCISSVVYNKTEQEQIIKKFLLKIVDKYEKRFDSSVRAVVSMKLTSWKMLFKQECFSHEQEVRIIVKVVDKYKDVWPIKYRTNAGYIIPYIVVLMPMASVEFQKFQAMDSKIIKKIKTLSHSIILHFNKERKQV